MSNLKVRFAKTGSRARRAMLGFLLRLDRGGASDPAALLSRFPDEAPMPLRRNGLDPVPALALARAKAPVSRLKVPYGLRGWLVTGYEDSKTLLATDPTVLSNDFGNMIGKVGIAAEQDPGGLGFADPPAHTRLRRMLAAHFTTRALTPWGPRIQQIVGDALDETAAAGASGESVDLQQHFAFQIPARTIMEILGVDEANRDEFQRLSTQRFDMTNGATTSLDTIAASIALLQEVVARQRVEPTEGLISAILNEHGDGVGDVELAGLIDGVLTGGLETTVSMLTLGAVVLLQDRTMLTALREQDDYAEPLVEELLRYLTVVQVAFPRFACRDVTIGGQTMFAGDVVVCSLAGANRDPRHGGPSLDHVDPLRPSHGHLAFGHGLHRCIGAELARLELRLAYPALARRFPDMELAVAPGELEYRQLSLVHGLERLPVRLNNPAGRRAAVSAVRPD